MSSYVLNTNKSADISSAFLDSAISAAVESAHNRGAFNDNSKSFIALPPAPENFHPAHKFDRTNFAHMDNLLTQDVIKECGFNSLAEGRESTKDYRLVKMCKSPTRLERAFKTYLESKRMQSQNEFFARAKALDAKHQEWLKLSPREQEQRRVYKDEVYTIDTSSGFAFSHNRSERVDETTGEIFKRKVGIRGAVARLFGRDWSGETRMRVMAQASLSEPPPQQSGDRETSELSQKGASKILDSGAYVATVRGGFTTFLTLTFDAAARERIASGENTMGKEVSRFFDAGNKMYKRGWQFTNDENETVKVPPTGDALDYVWVAEMPENKKGEPNPHCHVLLRWNVEKELFKPWAKRIESLWGLGFAKLERIKNANAASGYLLKALGYMVKGESQDQGQFKGNRYNISKSARAPAWECLAEFEAQNMCAIINEIREKLERKDKPVRAVINKTKWRLNAYKKAYKIQQATKGRTQAERNHVLGKMKKRITDFEQDIKDNYEKLTSRGVRANEYQITFNSDDLLAKFIGWANTKRLWGAEMLSGFTRDCEKERAALGELVKQGRDYYKSFGDNGEYAEFLWDQRLKQGINNNFEEPKTCDVYEEYLGMMA